MEYQQAQILSWVVENVYSFEDILRHILKTAIKRNIIAQTCIKCNEAKFEDAISDVSYEETI